MSQKNKIDIPQSIASFEEKGLMASFLNPHAIRIQVPGSSLKWDWFHTTGTLLKHANSTAESDKSKKYMSVREVLGNEEIKEQLDYNIKSSAGTGTVEGEGKSIEIKGGCTNETLELYWDMKMQGLDKAMIAYTRMTRVLGVAILVLLVFILLKV